MTIIIGASGTFLLLLAFGMNQLNKWKNDYLVFDLTNAVGAILLIVYAVMIDSYPFIILFLVWLSLAVWDVFSDWDRNRKRERKDFFGKWLK